MSDTPVNDEIDTGDTVKHVVLRSHSQGGRGRGVSRYLKRVRLFLRIVGLPADVDPRFGRIGPRLAWQVAWIIWGPVTHKADGAAGKK